MRGEQLVRRNSRTLHNDLYILQSARTDPAAEMHFDTSLGKPSDIKLDIGVDADYFAARRAKRKSSRATGSREPDYQRTREAERAAGWHYWAKFSK
jgi:hypothetical protein